MNQDEVFASMKALHDLCNALLGKLEAVQVTQDAVVGALVRSLPPMLEPIQNNVRMLAAARAQHVEPGALESFRNNIATIQKGLLAMGQRTPGDGA
ncbi:MAG TPA: hypothetical protein VHA82_05140 [Ramlibacter sp.]|uniref:hypothetical protein n=1 Tax=Ramlibacter sp. TaxID=1917967 RepID=UPI002CA90710|nr:hypothetical protein [Ramlibacter sp.]HVZ43175.1 hypothetical protein [Ramlibacter sp.]